MENEQQEKSSYGQATVGYGTREERKLDVKDFVQTHFKDNRLISVSTLEDDSILIMVENPSSTGRNTQSNIWLSKESVVGLLTTVMVYFHCKDENMEELLKTAVEKQEIDYVFSDNLKPFEP